MLTLAIRLLMFVYERCLLINLSIFFFFNDTATTEIYTLSLHDALPISPRPGPRRAGAAHLAVEGPVRGPHQRSEEHTSELQSHSDLVCRLLLEKKKNFLHMASRKHSIK